MLIGKIKLSYPVLPKVIVRNIFIIFLSWQKYSSAKYLFYKADGIYVLV